MFEQNLFIAHLYTSFGEMSPQKCELLQFSCIHKFFSFVKCPKTLNHKDGGDAHQSYVEGVVEGSEGQKPQGKSAVLSLPCGPAPALACGHVLFRDFLTSCILLLDDGNWTGMRAITLRVSLVSGCSDFQHAICHDMACWTPVRLSTLNCFRLSLRDKNDYYYYFIF